MTAFRIPNAFYLFGQRITVEWRDDLVDGTDCVGMTRLRKNTIELQKGDGPQIFRPRSQTEQTFWHELTHWILDLLGETELSGNEKLIDSIGSLLHQAVTTMEYGEDYGGEVRKVDYSRVMGS
jgi:hypothetical protein